jgi:NADH dehydrogenase FAD-containing subunit
LKKKLVLIGGGHAHMVTLANIAAIVQKGHRVTVIGPSDHHYYSGMGPGMLSGTYRPEEIRFATRHVVEKQGGTFIKGKANRIDPANKIVALESGEVVAYDVLSCNAGSHVPKPHIIGAPQDVYTVKPIERLMEASRRLVDHFHRHEANIVIAGGGPSAAEVAGNVWQLAKTTDKKIPKITICPGKSFMSRFPESIQNKILTTLTRRNIVLHQGPYVSSVSPSEVHLDNGENLKADFVFLALGVNPSPIFTDSGISTGPDGGLLVNQYLQSVQHPDIFGGGDCIYFEDQPLDKVGVYAVRQNPVLFHNMVARLDGDELQPFDPDGEYLLIFNLGDRNGVLKKRWLEFGGRPAFIIKDYIDRKFMTKFQSME